MLPFAIPPQNAVPGYGIPAGQVPAYGKNNAASTMHGQQAPAQSSLQQSLGASSQGSAQHSHPSEAMKPYAAMQGPGNAGEGVQRSLGASSQGSAPHHGAMPQQQHPSTLGASSAGTGASPGAVGFLGTFKYTAGRMTTRTGSSQGPQVRLRHAETC
jgi:hypothetical protein